MANTVGKRLRAARESSGLNQTRFGSRCGVGKAAQMKFELGRHMPGGSYWLALAAPPLNIDAWAVLFGLPGAMNADEAEVLTAFRLASREAKGAILDALRGAAEPEHLAAALADLSPSPAPTPAMPVLAGHQPPLTPAQASEMLDRAGVSVAEFARHHDLKPNVVYRVLYGDSKGQRGEAHRVAVALGLKTGESGE